MDITELDRESAELLPDRQALGCWSWDSCHHWRHWSQCWDGWQQHCGWQQQGCGW